MANGISRRNFVKTGVVAAATTGMLGAMRVHAADTSVLKVGLVGCGGRGRGAAQNALAADPHCKLVAVGDAFADKARGTVEGLQSQFGDRIDVGNRVFDGLECYKQVIPECDVVLLCEAPHFRPFSLRAAIEAGKHVFCEKPVAVDGPGILSVLESAKMAQEKKLNLVSGLCWRYDINVNDMMKRIKDGAIGEICAIQMNYLTGKLWTRPRLENDTEMMAQVRNWYNFTWLSGDFNVEQHIHSLDKGLWAMDDAAPLAAYGLGGRMARVEQPDYGDIYDEMSAIFEYPNGVRLYSFCRQQNGCWNETDDYFMGTKGYANIIGGAPRICDRQGNVIYAQAKVPSNMYVREHEALFTAIRSGGATYINNGEFMARSTMLGILERMACYTGKRITWEEGLKAPALLPSGYDWNATPPTVADEKGRYKVSIPGMGDVYHTVTR